MALCDASERFESRAVMAYGGDMVSYLNPLLHGPSRARESLVSLQLFIEVNTVLGKVLEPGFAYCLTPCK